MKVTKEKAAQNKEAILEAASHLYRERGIDGIGIGELARSTGLTHGGFYKQFPGGKEQLVTEAVRRAFAPEVNQWHTARSISEIVDGYLADAHICNEGDGCPIPAMAADVARNGGPISTEFTSGIRDLMGLLAERAEGQTPEIKQANAAQILASIAGAILIVRAVDDPELSALIINSVKSAWSSER
ncbi:TetR/AcrR family transcriptional regulator [Pseudomonas sp. CCI3.2]|uniref:TetR/AcrR family transcriptional regulator n=1 Tax=unclassified Pseudomonas TaxID=196821 RepID=UPI002AC9CC66|nr:MULTISPECIES: TetR/AcrR family transcriptional regulator [unclassified Pseudomonas]MEB0077690.1 TetR/AcrR family transcriptional regulator [Pseudomonas sp. MH10out]MEB0090890.1 TetR/AcrR family transcriptional regulator [Pseudomonas sp. CCI4.2]MEB0101316.1 TetR/AcrR family transcriptional regulator [Pseudomonas sp. CCI3.2]MEB0131423.1 TetR/AcrR family transcriptional regulator [Pseudomonas sp. CCI2.4]MEB0158433.1 TetR/AcrR family transcriptional regulator [Pseudomonas sp. AH2 (2023)]